MESVWIIIYGLSAAGLAVYGANSIFLTVRFLRYRERRHECPPGADGGPGWPPSVTVQLPLYNEMNVVLRLLWAVLALDYPRDRLVVQLLDDSTDGTVELVRKTVSERSGPGVIRPVRGATVEEWHDDDGLLIQYVRRDERTGYKAGALDLGMRLSVSDVYAVFDADFVPSADFLSRLTPHLADPRVAFVQARWGHLNRRGSLLTRAQALAMDAHFAVEQQARFASGYFFNFNGTAGLWRGAAIRDAGGWLARTLTEDLDLSYRAQLAGWRAAYDADVVVPGEIPRDLNALKNQQYRWAKGSLQTARLLVGPVLRSHLPRGVKAQAVIHLSAYLVHPLLLTLLLATTLLIRDFPMMLFGFGFTAVLGLGPPLMVTIGQRHLHVDWWKRVLVIPFLTAVGVGIAVVSSRAAIEALLGLHSGFVRTPKEGSGRRLADYRSVMGFAPLLEMAVVITAAWALQVALSAGRYGAVPFLALYTLAFGYVVLVSLATALRSVLGATSGR